MTIERVGKIFFDDLGPLIASTRWISTHDEGIAERAVIRRSAPNRTLNQRAQVRALLRSPDLGMTLRQVQ